MFSSLITLVTIWTHSGIVNLSSPVLTGLVIGLELLGGIGTNPTEVLVNTRFVVASLPLMVVSTAVVTVKIVVELLRRAVIWPSKTENVAIEVKLGR
jgi:hypothetical protein